ncbi:MAG: SufD family Fe-S cluster assembly protein [Candidatus Gracilibacteria bacterium]
MTCISIDNQSPDSLIYDQGGVVIVFDQTHAEEAMTRTILIKNNTQLEWYGVMTGGSHYRIHFVTESGKSLVHILFLSYNDKQIQVTVQSTLDQSHTSTDIHLLSLVADNGSIDLNGTVEITSGIEKVSGHILEENIFLGSRGQIRVLPSLLVHSDDVEAGHAARIERISDEKLYYLRARGIPRDDAVVMMIKSSVFGLFSGLDEEKKEEIMSHVLAIL